MSFRVFWAPAAEERLERIRAAFTDGELVVAAAKRLDQLLIESPNSLGESRERDSRVGFVKPLGVYFEVMDDVRTVIVHDVWRTDGK